MPAGGKRRIVKDCLDYFGGHGLSDIRNTRTGWRLVWICAVVVAYVYTGISIYWEVSDYLKYNTVTTVTVRHMSAARFPAVTVCNLNTVKMSKADDRIKRYLPLGERNASHQAHKSWSELESAAQPEMSDHAKEQARAYKGYYILRVDYDEVGHQLRDMMLECVFDSHQCSAKNFTKWLHPEYGNCYTFTTPAGHGSSIVGPHGGLSLVLFAETDEYVAPLVAGAGFRVQVHPANYAPIPEDLGVSVSTGLHTSLAVRQSEIHRLPQPYDDADCADTAEHKYSRNLFHLYAFWNEVLRDNGYNTFNYSVQPCVRSCIDEYIWAQCDCVDPAAVSHAQIAYHLALKEYVRLAMEAADCDELDHDHEEAACTPHALVQSVVANRTDFKEKAAHMQLPQPCDKADEAVRRCFDKAYTELEQNTGSVSCGQDCPQSCDEVVYNVRASSALWPTDAYIEHAKSGWIAKNPNMHDQAVLASTSAVHMNVARLDVFFQELNYESVTELEALPLTGMLSNVGGVIGLYCGMSVLSVLQIVELIARLAARRRRPADSDADVETAGGGSAPLRTITVYPGSAGTRGTDAVSPPSRPY